MIWKNFFRDLRHTASRLVSVSIITMIAVVVYTGLSGILYNADRVSWAYFDAQNVADYWITGSLDQGDCRTLEALAGVTGVQPRVQLDAEDADDSSLTLVLYGVPEDYAINTPYLTEGALPASNREILLSDVYAKAHGLAVGDWYELTLTGLNIKLRLRISGLAKDPECLYHVSATMPAPDLTLYGFAYVNEGVLQDVVGANCYNQVCVTTDDSISDEQFRQAVEAALGDKAVNILALEDNAEAYTILETRDNIAPILTIFPVLFFLCAVLMMVSTMNRLVENSRSDIGTFKALGYSDTTILFYYLLHALLVVAVGFPIGAYLGKYIAALIVSTIATGSDLPPYTIVHDFSSWWQALALTVLCCVGSAWLVCRSLLRETPAQCMRPKPPKAAKAVLLERIPPLWRRLSFSRKYIIRNTLRNKVRMVTCVFGVAFCMALVFLAFAIKDSMDHYTTALAENQNRYDLMLEFSTSVTQEQYTRVSREEGVSASELEMTTACWLYSEDHLTTAALTVAEDTVTLKLYDPYADGAQTLPENGVVLEQSLAEQLGVQAGDMVSLRFVGNHRLYRVQVAEVNRCVSGVYASRSFWRSLSLPYTPTAAYVTTADLTALTTRLERYDFVDGWQTRETATAAVMNRMSSTSLVAYVLILFGGGLACIVIYNLGIMSFFEQIRSLATLMVLGFYDREIKKLQLSENIIFAVAGILLGIPLGFFLNRMILSAITTMPLEEATQPLSLVLSCALTLSFAVAVNWVIGRKMRGIDMLGALKSVE